jgi:hypothetical protein
MATQLSAVGGTSTGQKTSFSSLTAGEYSCRFDVNLCHVCLVKGELQYVYSIKTRIICFIIYGALYIAQTPELRFFLLEKFCVSR